MKTYLLKHKNDRDIISKCLSGSYEDACDYFSQLKRLPISNLLKIYIVVSDN
jgi:hypothetical protein